MEATPVTETTCRHHWILGQPKDGAVRGICRKCSLERAFPAYIDDYGRSDEREEQPARDAMAGTAVGGARLSRSASPAGPEA
jgi:hypothetical protein